MANKDPNMQRCLRSIAENEKVTSSLDSLCRRSKPYSNTLPPSGIRWHQSPSAIFNNSDCNLFTTHFILCLSKIITDVVCQMNLFRSQSLTLAKTDFHLHRLSTIKADQLSTDLKHIYPSARDTLRIKQTVFALIHYKQESHAVARIPCVIFLCH